MRYSVALAVIPVLAWGAWPAKQIPVAVKPVETEGVRAQRPDDESFGRRWAPVTSLAPAVQLVTKERSAAAAVSPPVTDPEDRRRSLRARSASLDICARHHMRKVHYGRTWRCRR